MTTTGEPAFAPTGRRFFRCPHKPCVAAGRVIYYAGDYMIGFHPLLLFLIPYAGVLGLAAMVGCAIRKWHFAAMAAVSVLAVLGFVTQGYRIGLWAWSQSIRQYDAANQEVIGKSEAIPELTDETLMENLHKDQALPVVNGFGWYCEHHHASPGGTFRAFRYRSVVHVRIQKIRHGCRQSRSWLTVHATMHATSRCFSANTDTNVFHCFRSGKKGDVIDLWQLAQRLTPYDAAIDLCQQFQLRIKPDRIVESMCGAVV